MTTKHEPRSILLGLDAGGAGDPATDWAAAEAASRGLVLHIVRTYRNSFPPRPWGPINILTGYAEAEAEALMRRTVTHLERRWPDLPITCQLTEGAAAGVLVEESDRAALTVVGRHPVPVLEACVLGSVTTAVAARAHSPVVVAGYPPEFPDQLGAVVVGVSAQRSEHDVLAFAFDSAARDGRTLRAVLCWWPDWYIEAGLGGDQSAPEQVKAWFSEALAGWQEKYPDVTVEARIVDDHPVTGLAVNAYGQHMLVIGNHGRRARVDLLLGSVTQGVLRHARCPVAVIGADRD